MTAAPSKADPPSIEVERTPEGRTAVLSGRWTLRDLGGALERLRAAQPGAHAELAWDLRGVAALDTTGALILWRAWDRRFPPRCRIRERHRRLFDYWLQQDEAERAPAAEPPAFGERAVAVLAAPARAAQDAATHWLAVIGDLCLDTGRILRHPLAGPWREVSATIYLAGARALPITGLVGFMVGIVVAYLSALQLSNLGADQFIVDMLGYAVIRELGPLIGAIIVAGRSGSAMTAQIGVMRLAQELDAMVSLGMSISGRVVWPRVAALVVIMPLIVLWTIVTGLAGGITGSYFTLGLGLEYFMTMMPERVPIENLWIGTGKGIVFGAAVGLTASYFGLRIKPNTRDLGARTTQAVVVAITLVILIDAVFAILLREVGF